MDTKDRENKSRNVETKGHNELEIPWSNPLCAYCYQKAERLSCAVYMITSHTPNSDPLPTRLREKCLCLLSEIICLRHFNKRHFGTNGHTDSHAEKIVTDIHEITSLITVAETCRYISTMNAALLKGEYVQLARIIRERSGELGETRQLPRKYFAVPFSDEVKQSQIDNDRKEIAAHRLSIQKSLKSQGQRDNTHSLSDTTEGEEKQIKESSNIRHSNRKGAILDLLNKKEKVNIRDVADVIHDCSEKTLQRELLALVRQGVLKKEGERRWSVYSRA